MGFNEAAGYGAVAVTALATGFIAARYGLRPEPFFLGVAYAGLGLGLSTLFVRETRGHARHEADHARRHDRRGCTEACRRARCSSSPASRRRRCRRACQAGMVNNLNDGLAWGIFPLYFAAAGLSVGRIGVLAALYPAVWGLGQLVTGALSDRIGRKRLIAGGMLTQAVAIGLDRRDAPASGRGRVGALLLGAGTAMVYPTLLAAIGDVAHPDVAGVARSASTDSGATAGSPSAPSSPASSPTRSASTPRSGPSPRSPPRPGSWSPSACTRPTGQVAVPRSLTQSARPHRRSGDRRRVPRAVPRTRRPLGPGQPHRVSRLLLPALKTGQKVDE